MRALHLTRRLALVTAPTCVPASPVPVSRSSPSRTLHPGQLKVADLLCKQRCMMVTTAAATGLTQLAFMPQHAALGGTILGVATVGNLLLNGRVLGISGAVKGLVSGDAGAWRITFLAGLLLAGHVMAGLVPGSFETLPASYTATRALAGGLLVGLGASLGNGCTSGHGICGNARLSVRSLVYTLTFMAAGAVAATASGAAAALGVAPLAPPFVPLTADEAAFGLKLLGGGVAALLALAAGWRALQATGSGKPGPALAGMRDATQAVASGLVGAIFGTGLALSGMARPSKVVGFLSVLQPAWDPSLLFVMAAAVGVSIIVYQLVLGTLVPTPPPLKQPLLAAAYALPSAAARVDAKLIAGGLLFGTGWGLTGMCPGPALVVAASPFAALPVWTYLGGMLAGMAVVEPTVSRLLFAPPSVNTARSH